MEKTDRQSYTAFDGQKLIFQGTLEEVVLKVKKRQQAYPNGSLLVFSDATGKQMDFDLRGSEKEILQRLETFISPNLKTPSASGPGRPKLGVVAREVSLLPRHWEWLSTQSEGASGTIRRLIDSARTATTPASRLKQYQERTYKFMEAIAGNLPGYEEALRALYSKNKTKFKDHISSWPQDVRTHASELANPVFDPEK